MRGFDPVVYYQQYETIRFEFVRKLAFWHIANCWEVGFLWR